MRLRAPSAFLLALWLCSCTGGTDSATDAALFREDAGVTCLYCNPITQACCDSGEKCAHLLEQEEPRLGATTCVPVGVVLEGQACRRGEAGPATGFDDCAAGLHCFEGACAKICVPRLPDLCRPDDEGESIGTYCKRLDYVFWSRFGVCVQVPKP